MFRGRGHFTAHGTFIAADVALLQVRHGRGFLQLLLLNDGPIRIRRRRRGPGHRGGRHEPVESGQPVTHRARNRHQWPMSHRDSSGRCCDDDDDPCARHGCGGSDGSFNLDSVTIARPLDPVVSLYDNTPYSAQWVYTRGRTTLTAAAVHVVFTRNILCTFIYYYSDAHAVERRTRTRHGRVRTSLNIVILRYRAAVEVHVYTYVVICCYCR